MLEPPWTNIGNLQQDVHRIDSELKGKVNNYEISSINSRLDSLERSNRELSTLCNELLSRMQTHEEKVIEIENTINTKARC